MEIFLITRLSRQTLAFERLQFLVRADYSRLINSALRDKMVPFRALC